MAKSWSRTRSDELYRAALQRAESDRRAFLEDACAGDLSLLREVQSRLSSAELSAVSTVDQDNENKAPRTESSWGSWSRSESDGPTGWSDADSVGRRLSHYEILAPLGSGGMGQVFRARDLSLGREVAIKVMHTGGASKPDRLRRFEREARAAAALNHPNIATVYEVGEHEGTPFISMELVEGLTLRQRLEKGPLSADEALSLATQVAGALAKAHAAGVVHRDLKPGNLMVTHDGLAKILDFGLVKLLPKASTGSDEITGDGSVVGTVDYMSPEQALARPLDHRSDQFSFGSILYEMATGKRPFEREQKAQTLLAIVECEPEPLEWHNAETPPGVRTIVKRCLAKDPAERYESTDDLATALERVSRGALPDVGSRASRRRVSTGVLAVVALAAGVATLTTWLFRDRGPRTTVLNAVPLTSYPGREVEPTFSPDASQVAFTWDGPQQENQDIYVKVIGSEQPLRLTSHRAQDGSPAWSPDGRRIAFLRRTPGGGCEVLTVSPTGGPERRLTEIAAPVDYGLAWSPDGRWLATVDRPSPEAPVGVVLLDPRTGAREPLTALASSAGRGDVWPAFSPDGHTLAFRRSVAPTANRLYLLPTTGGEARELVPTTAVTSPFAWTPDGEEIVFAALTFAEEGSPPRPSTRSNTGSPPVLWRVPIAGGAPRQLGGSAYAAGVAVSRTGGRLVYTEQTGHWEIWRLDLRGSGEEAPTRLIASTRFDGNPQFSPDARRIVFTSARSGAFEIWVADADGANPLRLTSLARSGSVGSPRWSPDGESVAFDFLAEGDAKADIYVVAASGGPPRRVTTAEAADVRPSWSGDGRWIYFGSHRGGSWQVWKVPVAGEDHGGALPVTRGGGYAAIESVDGEHLYFSRRRSVPDDPANAIWRVPVEGGDEEMVLESLSSSDTNWDVTAEGIYFIDRPDAPSSGDEWIIKLRRFDSGRVFELARLEHAPRLRGPAFSVSPDGRWVLVSQLQEESDLMLVEGFR